VYIILSYHAHRNADKVAIRSNEPLRIPLCQLYTLTHRFAMQVRNPEQKTAPQKIHCSLLPLPMRRPREAKSISAHQRTFTPPPSQLGAARAPSVFAQN